MRTLEDRLWQQFLRNLRRCRIRTGSPVVVALSGGPDSTVLAYLFHRWAQHTDTPIVLAHYMHPWPATAAWEATVAETTARKLQLPLETGRAPRTHPGSRVSETELRRMRMAFLVDVAHRHHAQAIAVGHHRDDQVETVLLRLARGAGPYGLRGMQWRQPYDSTWLVRPLLNVPGRVLRMYAHMTGMHVFIDPTNWDVRIDRNWIRYRLLPLLEERFPRIRSHIWQLTRWLQQDNRALVWIVRSHMEHTTDRWSVRAWRRLPVALRVHWIRMAYRRVCPTRPLGRVHIRAAMRLLMRDGGHGRLLLPEGVELWRDGPEWGLRLRDTAPSPPRPWTVPWTGEGAFVDGNGQTWVFTRKRRDPTWSTAWLRARAQQGVWYLDADVVHPPGTIRTYRPGDRFQPLGTVQTVRLRRFFIARKLPYDMRRRVPILETARGIAAVLGVAIAEWARVQPQTQWVWEVRRA